MEDDGLGLSLGIKSFEKRPRRTPSPSLLPPVPLKHCKNSIFYMVDHFHKSPPEVGGSKTKHLAPYTTTLNLGWIGAKPKRRHNHKGLDREISISDGEVDGGGHADQRGDVGVAVAAGGGEGGPKKKKLRLSKEQSSLLEQTFLEHSTLNNKQKLYLAKELKLMPRQVEVWFQNRRARTKVKQTEVDCEFLKEYCKRLSEENRRLHKELQQLTPPSGLVLCHACNRGSATPTPSSVAEGGRPRHTLATTIRPVDQPNVSGFFFKKAFPAQDIEADFYKY